MTDAPNRIWTTGNGETGSWNATEGRMKTHLPDGWQAEYLLATPAREAAEDLVAVIQTIRDYVSDTADGNIELSDAIRAMARGDLIRIDAALARAKGGS